MLNRFKSQAEALKSEMVALSIAARDPRTPWLAKAVALATLAYAVSPIDLIPDFVPFFGYLDDWLIVPAGFALASKLIPTQVMEEAREKSRQAPRPGRALKIIGTLLIALIWFLAIIALALIILHFLREKK